MASEHPQHPLATAQVSEAAVPAARAEVARIAAFFEALTPDSLAQFGHYYTPDAYFKDPFNEVRGLSHVQRVFSHMYVALDQPRFVVTTQVVDGRQAFLCWDFLFCFKGQREPRCIRGSSHLKLAEDGRIAWHRDYWDVAEELYEKLPALGTLMRWLKRRAARA